MIFTEEEIKAILLDEKVQHRVLVKEGEYSFLGVGKCINSGYCVKTKTNKVKWQNSKTYSIQKKRGGKGLWYCPKCMGELSASYRAISCDIIYACKCHNYKCHNQKLKKELINLGWKPLRFVVVSIKQEKLFDISQEDAKREGYSSRLDFLVAFNTLNNKQYSKSYESNYGKVIDEALFWNPLVWVLEFEVVK